MSLTVRERLVYDGMDESESLTVNGAGRFVHTPGAARAAGLGQHLLRGVLRQQVQVQRVGALAGDQAGQVAAAGHHGQAAG